MSVPIYAYNGISVSPPTGSIMSFLGTVDPDGWVIMDGQERINTGQYNNLIMMGIGSGAIWTSGPGINYTPPNYQAAFLRGIGTSNGYSGPDLNVYQQDQTALISHNHTISLNDPGHFHTTIGNVVNGPLGQDIILGGNLPGGNGYGFCLSKKPDLGAVTSTSTTGITSASSTNTAISQEIRPYNYGVNWILKL
jgi:hypothetical protein